jgi:hypothetical protein
LKPASNPGFGFLSYAFKEPCSVLWADSPATRESRISIAFIFDRDDQVTGPIPDFSFRLSSK